MDDDVLGGVVGNPGRGDGIVVIELRAGVEVAGVVILFIDRWFFALGSGEGRAAVHCGMVQDERGALGGDGRGGRRRAREGGGGREGRWACV